MAAYHARAEKMSTVDLRLMNRVLELAPEDMTVTVESGISLGTLQKELARHGQWLPIDPPNADGLSIRDVLSKDLSGPRRFGYGTIREHLIGMKVVLADGRVIKSGGKVVKNVAGYDLAKLFIGARDSLGIIVEATFKLRPLPSIERFVYRTLNELTEARTAIRIVLDSDLTSVVLDAHNLTGAGAPVIVLGFAGTSQEVDWQIGQARAFGFEAETKLEYEIQFWSDATPAHHLSVLPSRLIETIAGVGSRPFVARAGNGVVYYRGEKVPQKHELPLELTRRIKSAYDPKNILPELRS